jgi:hypothetical protein
VPFEVKMIGALAHPKPAHTAFKSSSTPNLFSCPAAGAGCARADRQSIFINSQTLLTI